jgi:hypothetical protein
MIRSPAPPINWPNRNDLQTIVSHDRHKGVTESLIEVIAFARYLIYQYVLALASRKSHVLPK